MTLIQLFTFFLLLITYFDYSNCFFQRTLFPSADPANQFLEEIHSKPLFLTPYIKSNKIDEGRKLSEIKEPPFNNIKSYSGFLTVNDTYESNMFFWFFPALSGKTNVPILLWLQGGPGGSSLFGLFVENGPWKVLKDGNIIFRKNTWNREFAVLYIDNPVGSGFSFTKDDRGIKSKTKIDFQFFQLGYAVNQVDVMENLYEALKQFFTLHYEYKGNPFFLTGESYAGKYIPAIAYKIHSMGSEAKKYGINLQGMAIGDGWCDPINMLNYGEFLYQIGLIDQIQKDFFLTVQEKTVKLMEKKEFLKAAILFDILLAGDFGNKSYFSNMTGLQFYYNILYDRAPDDYSYYVKLLSMDQIRDSIHVGNLPYGNVSLLVEMYLVNDIMDSVKPWIETLLDAGYRILFYNGQLDIIVAVPLTENFLKKLKWHGAQQYQTAPRNIYKLTPNDQNVAGYIRQVKNMAQITIRNAGHILPYDQPKVALDMITKFVKNVPF